MLEQIATMPDDKPCFIEVETVKFAEIMEERHLGRYWLAAMQWAQSTHFSLPCSGESRV